MLIKTNNKIMNLISRNDLPGIKIALGDRAEILKQINQSKKTPTDDERRLIQSSYESIIGQLENYMEKTKKEICQVKKSKRLISKYHQGGIRDGHSSSI